MKIRQTIKRVAALGIGATMLGATLMGAVAADLKDYPQPFVKDGKFSGTIVIGEKAMTADVLGAVDIAASLQADSYTSTTVKCSGTGVSVTNGKNEEVQINELLSVAFGTIDDNDVSSMTDSKISWNDKELDVKEKLTLPGTKVMYSADDEKFDKDLYLGTTGAAGIVYTLEINDNDLDYAAVTADEPIKVDFLGKAIEITNINETSDKVTMAVANEHYLSVGDTVTVEGKTVKLVNVGSGVVSVDVDGTTKLINTGATSKVNGISIQVVNVFYVDDIAQRAAVVKVGDKITQVVDTGDSMELFGEPSTASKADWVWRVEATTGNFKLIADHNQVYDQNTEPVKAMGESFNLPNDYLSVELVSTNVEADKTVEVAFESGLKFYVFENETTISTSDVLYDNEKALTFTSDDSVFEVRVGATVETTTKVYLLDDGTNYALAFDNDDGDRQFFSGTNSPWVAKTSTTENFQIVSDETKFNVTAANDTVSIVGEGTNTDDLVLNNISIANKKLGHTEKENDATVELVVNGVTLDGWEENYRTIYGTVVQTPEDGVKADTLTFDIAPEQVKANVVVKGSDSVVAGGAGGSGTSQVINPIAVGIAVLDKDASGTGNQIVVGGPCVNTVAAALMGNSADCAAGFEEGMAKIKLFESGGKVSLLVAGYSAQDTQGACRVLANSEDYSLAGTEKTVVVTSLSNLKVQ